MRTLMLTPWRQLPQLPEIGHPESYYAQQLRDADKLGSVHFREATKVGQYVTLAMDPRLEWDKKLRYVHHALRRHCVAPALADNAVQLFYKQLAALVRQHAGQEALRLASAEDDLYAARLRDGVPRYQILGQADTFFRRIMGHGDECPDHFSSEDWAQLKLLRAQWV